jgi:hypothetical protein
MAMRSQHKGQQVTDRTRYTHLSCRACGRLANPLYGGLCVPCLDLQDELDEIAQGDTELSTDPRYFQ